MNHKGDGKSGITRCKKVDCALMFNPSDQSDDSDTELILKQLGYSSTSSKQVHPKRLEIYNDEQNNSMDQV